MDMAPQCRSRLKARDNDSGEVLRGTVDNLVYSNAPLQMRRVLTPLRLVLRKELTDRFAVSLNHALKQFRIVAGPLRGELADLHGCVKHLPSHKA